VGNARKWTRVRSTTHKTAVRQTLVAFASPYVQALHCHSSVAKVSIDNKVPFLNPIKQEISAHVYYYERFLSQMDENLEKRNCRRQQTINGRIHKHEKTWMVFPHLNLAFQHQWIQAPYCLIEWRQPDPQFSEEHALLHTGTKPEDTNGKHK